MPQLDKFTFAPQVFWLILGFFFVYFLLLSTGLPRIYKVLLFRKKQLDLFFCDYKKLDKELVFTKVSLDNIFFKSLKVVRSVFDNTPKVVEAELNHRVINLKNKNNLNLVGLHRSLDGESILKELSFVSSVSKQNFYKNKSQLISKVIK